MARKPKVVEEVEEPVVQEEADQMASDFTVVEEAKPVPPVPPVTGPGNELPTDDEGFPIVTPYEGRENPFVSARNRAVEMRSQPEGVFDSSVLQRLQNTPRGTNPNIPTVLPPNQNSGLARAAPASPVHNDERAVFVPGVQAPDRIPAPSHAAARAEAGVGFYPVSPSEVIQHNLMLVNEAEAFELTDEVAATRPVQIAEEVGKVVEEEEGTTYGSPPAAPDVGPVNATPEGEPLGDGGFDDPDDDLDDDLDDDDQV